MPVFEGNLTPPPGRFALVAARFNQPIVESLVAGARDGLLRHGVAEDAIDLAWVPGSFEIPIVARRLAASKKYAAVICLGAIIRGDTDHYDHVANAATSGIAQAGLTTGVPVIFGVLTCEKVEQALIRAGLKSGDQGFEAIGSHVRSTEVGGADLKSGNKGFEAALTAIEMVNLLRLLP
jgi:6,7-dimethyl-8-ribityllumazine synthase